MQLVCASSMQNTLHLIIFADLNQHSIMRLSSFTDKETKPWRSVSLREAQSVSDYTASERPHENFI